MCVPVLILPGPLRPLGLLGQFGQPQHVRYALLQHVCALSSERVWHVSFERSVVIRGGVVYPPSHRQLTSTLVSSVYLHGGRRNRAPVALVRACSVSDPGDTNVLQRCMWLGAGLRRLGLTDGATQAGVAFG